MQKKELTRKVKSEVFDVKVQYCDPKHCLHDCLIGKDTCDSHKSTER